MNRLHHLKQTLPVNIMDNLDYEGLEFVVLDYNSTDGLGHYIFDNLKEHIDTGKLVYYRVEGPDSFHRSHSRNIAFKLASGELVCNVDADNYTGKYFASYINDMFGNNDQIFLNTISVENKANRRDVLGRICVKKEKFLQVGGYDESMHSYGFEDYDLVNRLELSGLQRTMIVNNEYLNAIDHSNTERISAEFCTSHFHALLLHHIDPSTSDIIFLFDNHTFRKGTIRDDFTTYSSNPANAIDAYYAPYRYSIVHQNWFEGEWQHGKDGITLETGGRIDELLYDMNSGCFLSLNNHMRYYELKDAEIVEQIVFFASQMTNRIKMQNNLLEKKVYVNEGSFGNAVVYKNFSYKQPINIL